MTSYLSAQDIKAIHNVIVRRLGRIPQPLLRPDLPASAVARPRWVAKYEGADLICQAARLGGGIARAHAFVDGNK